MNNTIWTTDFIWNLSKKASERETDYWNHATTSYLFVEYWNHNTSCAANTLAGIQHFLTLGQMCLMRPTVATQHKRQQIY